MDAVNRQLLLKAANGKHMSGIEVFSAAIKFLKEHFLENIKNRNAQSKVTVDKVRCVLTVPAIWNNAAKQFMRESAEKVTLKTNLNFLQAGIPQKNLSIALEPECASLYCQKLSPEKLGGFRNFKKVGSKYLILNNGGNINPFNGLFSK